MRIFVEGGSGLGKTTFCRMLSEVTGLPMIHTRMNDIIRSTPNWHSIDVEERQKRLADDIISLMRDNPVGIFDRSLFGLEVWTQYKTGYETNYECKYWSSDDFHVVLPIPSASFYEDNWSNWTSKVSRKEAYIGLTPLDVTNLTKRLNSEIVQKILRIHGIRYITPVPIEGDSFLSWQKDALRKLSVHHKTAPHIKNEFRITYPTDELYNNPKSFLVG